MIFRGFLISCFVLPVLFFLSCSSPKEANQRSLDMLKLDPGLEKLLARDMDCYRSNVMEDESDTLLTVVLDTLDGEIDLIFYPKESLKIGSVLPYRGFFRCKGFLFFVASDPAEVFKEVPGISREFETYPIKRRKNNEVGMSTGPSGCFSWTYTLKDGRFSRGDYDLCVDP